jgi:hypothetical protein
MAAILVAKRTLLPMSAPLRVDTSMAVIAMSSAAAPSELDKLGNSKVSGAAEAFHGAFAGGDRLWVSTV